MQPHGLVRSLYLYLAAFIGLALLTIGSVRLLDLGLKATVFTQAEAELRVRQELPPPTLAPERFGRPATAELTPVEQEEWRRWLEENRRWRERMAQIDHVAAQRQRTASQSLAMLLIGLPLYLYHWSMIRRELTSRTPASEGASRTVT